jgi:hypothetical protein
MWWKSRHLHQISILSLVVMFSDSTFVAYEILLIRSVLSYRPQRRRASCSVVILHIPCEVRSVVDGLNDRA